MKERSLPASLGELELGPVFPRAVPSHQTTNVNFAFPTADASAFMETTGSRPAPLHMTINIS